MSFGTVAFAEQSFATMQEQVLAVAVTGSALSMNAGSSSTTADANLTATGISSTSSIGSVSIVIDVSVSPTGISLTVSQGVGGTVAWETVSTGTAQTWTDVSKDTAQTWTDVDKVEKVE